MLGWVIMSGAAWATLVVTIGWFAWEVHLQQPHPGAVTDREFERLIDRVGDKDEAFSKRFDRMDSKLDRLIEGQK